MKPFLIVAASLGIAIPQNVASGAPKTSAYPEAQSIVDSLAERTPGLVDAILHVSPAPGAPNVVVAAHLRHANGESSGEDDLGVARTGAPLVEVQRDGVRLGVLVQLRDARRHPIGALGLMYAFTAGDDVEARVLQSFAIRDRLEHRIPDIASLVAPAG